MVAGKILPVSVERGIRDWSGCVFRVGVFAAVTWGLTLASWRWIERPLNDVRSRMPAS